MRKSEELEKYQNLYPDLSPVLIFKISMTKYGAVFTDRALARLQKPDYRFTKAEPFGISLEIRKEDFFTPGPVYFRDGSSVLVNFGEPYNDPYVIDLDPERDVFVARDGEVICDTVDFIPRPAFFDKVTRKGTPMDHIGGTCSGQRLLINAFQKCRFWENGEQCHYCALFSAGSVLPEVDLDDIEDTLKEAMKEPGRFSEISVSGGSDFAGDPPFSEEIERYIRVLSQIGTVFKDPVDVQLMAPAYPVEALKRLRNETCLTSYRPNIEIWDSRMWKQRCPGKEHWIGRDEWVRRMVDAVDVFGKGRVYTQMVCGAELAQPGGMTSVSEALDSAFAGCEFFAKHGISCHEEMWRPHRAEKLGWQEMQDLDYFIRLAAGFHDIRKSYGIIDTDGNFMRGSDNPDSDIERGEWCPSAPSVKTPEILDAGGSFYTAPELPEALRLLLTDKTFLQPGGPAPADGRSSAAAGLLELPGFYAEIPAAKGEATLMPVSGACFLNEKLLMIPLISDRSDLSSLLIRHLWFRTPVTLWLPLSSDRALKLTARVYRSYLVGPRFRTMLDHVRETNLARDMAQTAELHILACEETAMPKYEIIPNTDRFSREHLDLAFRV